MSGMFYKPILTLSWVESGCKFTRFLWTSKSSWEFFWKFMIFRICMSEKELFFDNLKHWISIHQPPLSTPLLQSVVPDCGCKDKPISSPFPNFFTHFLKVFSINRDRTFLIRHLEQWFFYAIFLSYSSLQNKSRLKEGGVTLSLQGFQK